MRWFLGAALLLAAALLLQSALLAYATYVLIGLLLVGRFFARASVGSVTASRTCSAVAANVGDVVQVTLKIRNGGTLPVVWVLLEDLLPRDALAQRPPRLKVRGKALQIRTLWGGQETTFRYKLECLMRGYYQIGPLVLESGDLFGLHRRYHIEAGPQYLLVYPTVVPLEGYDLASRRPIGDVRITHRLYEDPTRLAGVRRYEAGDPLNRVHWRATARTGELHSKLCEPSTLAGATVLLDLHEAGYPRANEPFRSDLAVTVAASLTHAVYQMGQQVGLVTNGRDAANRLRMEGYEQDPRTRRAAQTGSAMHERGDRLQPLVVETRRGVEQFERIREMLARVEVTDGLTFAELVQETTSRLPRDATVVAVLPDASVETALTLGNLRRRGHAVTAVLLRLEEYEFQQASGRLLVEGVEVRRLQSPQELPALCQRQVFGCTGIVEAPTEPPAPWDSETPYQYQDEE